MKIYDNVYKYYVFILLRNIFLLVSINILYYQSFGLSYKQIMTIAIVLSAVMVLLEMPSGVFADRYGRKLSLILSSIFLVIGATVLATSSSFLMFAIAMALM